METRNDYSATIQLSTMFTMRTTVQLGQWTNCPEEQNKALVLEDSFKPLQNIQKKLFFLNYKLNTINFHIMQCGIAHVNFFISYKSTIM